MNIEWGVIAWDFLWLVESSERLLPFSDYNQLQGKIKFAERKFISMETEIIVAIIAASATVMTIIGSIIGSIIATKMTTNAQLREQQIASNREMKRNYYAKFIDAFTKKLFYADKPDCVEKVMAEMEFVLEANKLPMYASEEMLQFIEKMKNPKAAQDTPVGEFLKILRNDLCENDFNKLSNQTELSLTVPNRIICSDENGRKTIVSSLRK